MKATQKIKMEQMSGHKQTITQEELSAMINVAWGHVADSADKTERRMEILNNIHSVLCALTYGKVEVVK